MRQGRHGVPDELGSLLLQVCFLPPAEAGAIWDAELAHRLSIADLPTESHGVLPLLHQRLVELDRRASDMARMQGVRRRLWVQNEIRLRAVGAAVDHLGARGVPVALLGGLAGLVGHLGRSDLRPLHDADLLVSAEDAPAAFEALEREGWEVEVPWRGGFLLDLQGVRCTDPRGQAISLRWSATQPYDDALDHTVAATLDGVSCPVVCAADLVLHTVLDGARAATGARTRWASDSLSVLLGGAGPDFDRLAESATARRGGPAVGDALALLDHLVPGCAPSEATRLAPSTALQRLLGAQTPSRPTLLRAYARRSMGKGLGRTLRGLPSYLSEVWEVPGPARLPLEAGRRAGRKLAGGQ